MKQKLIIIVVALLATGITVICFKNKYHYEESMRIYQMRDQIGPGGPGDYAGAYGRVQKLAWAILKKRDTCKNPERIKFFETEAKKYDRVLDSLSQENAKVEHSKDSIYSLSEKELDKIMFRPLYERFFVITTD